MTTTELLASVRKLRVERDDFLLIVLPAPADHYDYKSLRALDAYCIERGARICVVVGYGLEIEKLGAMQMAELGWFRVPEPMPTSIRSVVDRLSTEFGYLPEPERKRLAVECDRLLAFDYEDTLSKNALIEQLRAQLKEKDDIIKEFSLVRDALWDDRGALLGQVDQLPLLQAQVVRHEKLSG